MSKRDDISGLYMPSQKLGEFCAVTFCLNCALSIVNIFLHGILLNIVSVVQIALALGFVSVSVIDNGVFWYNAENERRKSNLQTAFEIRLSELETDGYYNNTVSPSIIKYFANTFESNYFSKFIASKMLIYSMLKSIVAVIVLVSVGWLIADGSILLVISQTIFSAYIVEGTVYLVIYVNRLNILYDKTYTLLVTTGIHTSKQIPILLSYCIEYECIKAHYKIRLDSKIFKKYNYELSKKWDGIYAEIVMDLPPNDTAI